MGQSWFGSGRIVDPMHQRATEPPDRDAEFPRLVGEVSGYARAAEQDDASPLKAAEESLWASPQTADRQRASDVI